MLNFINFICCDAPKNWQVTIQDPASPALEGMITFHEYLIFFLIQVVIAVCWFIWHNKQQPQSEKFTRERLIEILWTFSPAIILIIIIFISIVVLVLLFDL
jgi:heme/copper-type cytochrome/quinol oxidase subunit 2